MSSVQADEVGRRDRRAVRQAVGLPLVQLYVFPSARADGLDEPATGPQLRDQRLRYLWEGRADDDGVIRCTGRHREVRFVLAPGLIQGDPQHRNALHTFDGSAVLCDWDTIAQGQPEWDLVTVEVHCRRFGYGQTHYQAFASAYGWDVTKFASYPVLRDIRELRMVTANARKVKCAPHSLSEVQQRVDGLRRRDGQLLWNIL